MSAARGGKLRSQGFTLIELLVVIIIVAILATVATPSFKQLIESQRAKSAATDIYIGLARARSEALRLNQNVTLAPKSGSTDWASGWQIADPLHAGKLLEDHDAVRNLTVTGPPNVTYKSSGRVLDPTLLGQAISFTISGADATSTRYVCLDLSGRPSIKTSTCPL